MLAAIGGWVRMRGRAKQGEAHDGTADVVTVLAVVEQRDAVFAIAQVSPALRAHLEHRPRKAGFLVRRPPEVAELDLVRRLARADRHGKGDLQHLVSLLPVDERFETQHARTGVEGHGLIEHRLAEPASERELTSESATQLHLLDRRHFRERVAVLGVEIPRVPIARVVVVQLEQIPGPAQYLATDHLVPDRGQYGTVVPFDSEQLVLHAVIGDRDFGFTRLRMDNRPPARRSLDSSDSAIDAN